eukprot:6211818-Pleurochrysis_carterae.AAC.1
MLVRQELLRDERVDFASAIIKHPGMRDLEICVHTRDEKQSTCWDATILACTVVSRRYDELAAKLQNMQLP